MNLSPWFKSSEPPEHEGRYQIKDWLGHINYAEVYSVHTMVIEA